MNGDTRVTVLTPPGTGAIATVEISGPNAWAIASLLFRPAGKPLPEAPELHRFWFGTLGLEVGDEVILAVSAMEPDARVEVHCHGGRKVVQWVARQFTTHGCVEALPAFDDAHPWQLLTRAPTLRTASILLDQANGAFANSVQRLLDLVNDNPSAAIEPLRDLVRFSSVGRHLVKPWKVVIAGPPNVGKSSLVNALAGFQRAIVSEIAGTTRDLVTVQVAFDGWPAELTDTAGLRDAQGLEGEGIDRARKVLRDADLVLWVMDCSERELLHPDAETASVTNDSSLLLVMNKSDESFCRPPNIPQGAVHVSAVTGEGIPELIAAITARLVPDQPPTGVAVPFTQDLADRVMAAYQALIDKRIGEAIQLLSDCLNVDCGL